MPVVKNTRKIVKPTNEEEEILEKIFEEVLNQKNISIEDDFFKLGGDSLSAINLSTKIYDRFKIQVGIKYIFDNPTIKSLANLIKKVNTNEYDNKIS